MSASSDARLRDVLCAAVGADSVVTEGDDLAYYGSDRCSGGWPVNPRAIVFARSAADVQAVVTACAKHGASIVPSAGRTGLAGAATATAGEVVLSLERMERILEVNPVARTLRCEAGAVVESVQMAAREVGLMYPIEFAAQGSARIGGTIATNAGGLKVVRYGHTREWVMGLRVVVASGKILELGGPVIKNNTGYDLRQLFIGSEGTLGVIVEATLRLCRPPRGSVVALCAVPDDARVLDVFSRAQAAGFSLLAFECFDAGCLAHVRAHRGVEGAGPFAEPSPQHALIEVEVLADDEHAEERMKDALVECLAQAQEAGEMTDAVVAATPQQAARLWALREDISESLHRWTPHKADVGLPVERLTDFVASFRRRVAKALPGVEAVIFGHVGDGNVHLNMLRPDGMSLDGFLARCEAFDDEMYGLIRDHGGSISAEHGIGLLKRDYLHYTRSQDEIAMMRSIKATLDPGGLFNPGKIFEL